MTDRTITARIVLDAVITVKDAVRPDEDLLNAALDQAWPGLNTWTNADTGERFEVTLTEADCEQTS